MALLGALTAACTAEPGQLYGPGRTPGQSGSVSHPSVLVGHWETILVVNVQGDIQTWTTVWTFRADGTCRFEQTIASVAEDQDRITVRPCTWSAANLQITVLYTDEEGGSVVMAYSFPFLDGERLLLEGIEYRRVP